MNLIKAIRNPSPLELGIWLPVVFVAIALCMPIWTVWHVGGWCGVKDQAPAWTAASVFVDNLGKADPDELYWLYKWDLFQLGWIYALAWIIGISAYWIRKVKLRRPAIEPPNACQV